MKNKEKFAKEIVDLAIQGKTIAIDKDNFKIIACEDTNCDECYFGSMPDTCAQNVKKWAEEEYKEQLLDDIEKEYILNIIKPFKDKVKCIVLIAHPNNAECVYLSIKYIEPFAFNIMLHEIMFPSFEKGKMYKGLEINKKYTLEELGLED